MKQPVTSTPLSTTSTTQNGTNDYFTVAATETTLATDALSSAANPNPVAKDSPQNSGGDATSSPPSTTPKTLLSTSLNRTTTLIENPATHNYSSGNYSNVSATPEKLQERTTSYTDYLLNDTTTEAPERRPETTQQHVAATDPPPAQRPAQELVEYRKIDYLPFFFFKTLQSILKMLSLKGKFSSGIEGTLT